MQGDGTEVAVAEAAAVVGDRELHLLNGGHTALLVVHGVGASGVGQPVDGIQLLLRQTQRRRILHQHLVAVALNDDLSGDLVLLVVLLAGRLGVCPLVPADLCKVRTLHRTPWGVDRIGEVTGATDSRDAGDGDSLRQLLRQFCDLVFSHAVHEQIRTAVHQNGRAHTVIPVVIVGKAPEGCLQSADGDGSIRIYLPNFPAIGDDGTVGTQSGFAAGGVEIAVSFPLGGGVVRHHGVDVSAGDQKCQPRTSEAHEILCGVPVGLGNDSNAVAQ